VPGTAPTTVLPTPRTFCAAEPLTGMGTTLERGSGLDRSKTPACRTLDALPRQHGGRNPQQGTPRRPQEPQPPRPASCSSVPHSVLSTVVTHCAPPIRGEDDDFRSPRTCTPPLLMSIKGGGGLYLLLSLSLSPPRSHTTNSLASPARSPDIGTCLNRLIETWELSSLSRLACTPYYRHPRRKIVQCIRTPLR